MVDFSLEIRGASSAIDYLRVENLYRKTCVIKVRNINARADRHMRIEQELLIPASGSALSFI